MRKRVQHEHPDSQQVGPDARAERGGPHELHRLEERVEVREHLHPVREPVEREERPGDEEERREDGADDVAEALDRLRPAGDEDAEARPAEAGEPRDERHEQHGPVRVEAEEHGDEHRHAPVDAGARRDPQRLGGDELLRVDRRREDRVVGALELVLHERPEHRRERAREEDRGRDRAGADELDVVVAADRAHERAEAEAEREQVDRRLDGRRERRRPPVRGEVDDLADEDARDRSPLEPAESAFGDGRRDRGHPISSPVSRTNTSSRFAARRSPSNAEAFVPLTPRIEMLVPVRRVLSPAPLASDSTSARRAGAP